MPDDGSNFPLGSLNSNTLLSLQRGLTTVNRAKLDASKGATSVDSASKTKKPAADIEKAATDFEALLLHEMFQSMWSTVPKEGMLSGSHEEELFQDMLQESVAADVAEKQSIGIKDVLIRDMQRQEKQGGRRDEGDAEVDALHQKEPGVANLDLKL